jgi:hypothetical protein
VRPPLAPAAAPATSTRFQASTCLWRARATHTGRHRSAHTSAHTERSDARGAA